MTLAPLGGPGFPGSGEGATTAGAVLSAEVVESLGGRRYRIVIGGKLLEAVSSVSLGLGEEILARVRHAGPPVLLELLADDRTSAPPGREGAYAVVRGGVPGETGGETPAPALSGALTRLVASLPEPQRELLAKLFHAGASGTPALPRQVMEGLAQSLLSADPELRRIDAWIAALDEAHAARPAAAPETLAAALAEAIDALPSAERAALARAFPPGVADPAVADLRELLTRLPPDMLAAHPSVTRLAELARVSMEESMPAGAVSPTPAETAHLSADPDFPASREWIAALPAVRAGRLRSFLVAREERVISETPWSGPLREVARILDAPAPPGAGDPVPFSGASGHGVLRVFARSPEGEKKSAPGRKEPLRVGILLEMSRLGPVGAVVAGSPDGRSLDVTISADRDGSRALLREGLGALKSSLEAVGWISPVLSVAAPARRAAEAIFGSGEQAEGSIDVVA